MTHTEILDNIEEVLLKYFNEVKQSAGSTADIHRTLWEIYEDEFDADEERDANLFNDMVADAIEYGIAN